jgi:hypothetical protein
MRGAFSDQGGLFPYISPEARVPAGHPLRKIRALVRDALGELNRNLGKLAPRPARFPARCAATIKLTHYGSAVTTTIVQGMDACGFAVLPLKFPVLVK